MPLYPRSRVLYTNQTEEMLLTWGGLFAPAEELTVGMTVFDPDGLPCAITKINTHPCTYYRLSLSDRIEHFFADHLPSQDWGEWPICEGVQLRKFPKPLHIHPYLLGFILGDGGFSGASDVRVSKGDDLIEHLTPFLPKGCRIIHLDGPDYAIRGDGQYNEMLISLRRYGLMGHRSDTKFVPPRYLYGDIPTRTDVLAGLIDSDGTATKTGHLEFTTGSEQLAKDCAFLVRSLGGLIHMTTRDTASGKIGWRMPIWLPEGANPLRLPRKRARRALYKAKPLERIVKTSEWLGEGVGYEIITTSNEDGVLTEDCVPVW